MSSSALVGATDLIIDITAGATFPVVAPYQWVPCPDGSNVNQATWSWNNSNQTLVNTPPTSVSLQPCYVLKRTIRSRIITAGLETQYNAALAAQSAHFQAVFNEAIVYGSGDPVMIGLLNSIGANPSIILAADVQASQFFGVPSGAGS